MVGGSPEVKSGWSEAFCGSDVRREGGRYAVMGVPPLISLVISFKDRKALGLRLTCAN